MLVVLGVLVLAVYGVLAIMVLVLPGRGPSAKAGFTAREAYSMAQQEAQAWQDDAQLVGATASWNSVQADQLLRQNASWGFTFLSPQARQVRIVSVGQESAQGVQTINATPRTLALDPASWQVDSPQALTLFLDNGGREFLAQHPAATVTLRLGREQGAERSAWLAFGLDSSDRSSMTLQVDATTGEVTSPAR
jgi:hypothetical protein